MTQCHFYRLKIYINRLFCMFIDLIDKLLLFFCKKIILDSIVVDKILSLIFNDSICKCTPSFDRENILFTITHAPKTKNAHVNNEQNDFFFLFLVFGFGATSAAAVAAVTTITAFTTYSYMLHTNVDVLLFSLSLSNFYFFFLFLCVSNSSTSRDNQFEMNSVLSYISWRAHIHQI